MRRITFLAILFVSLFSNSQYHDEIKNLNKACSVSKGSISTIFEGYEFSEVDGAYVYSDEFNGVYYVIDFVDGKTIANYVETYNKENLRKMKASVKKADSGYTYRVYYFKEEDAIVITSIKN